MVRTDAHTTWPWPRRGVTSVTLGAAEWKHRRAGPGVAVEPEQPCLPDPADKRQVRGGVPDDIGDSRWILVDSHRQMGDRVFHLTGVGRGFRPPARDGLGELTERGSVVRREVQQSGELIETGEGRLEGREAVDQLAELVDHGGDAVDRKERRDHRDVRGYAGARRVVELLAPTARRRLSFWHRNDDRGLAGNELHGSSVPAPAFTTMRRGRRRDSAAYFSGPGVASPRLRPRCSDAVPG